MSELVPIFKPPWHSEDEFDAERAWRLIENLRDDKRRLLERLACLESPSPHGENNHPHGGYLA